MQTITDGIDVTGSLKADRVYPCFADATTTYFDHPTGTYGSIQINGSGKGNWEGYSIDGRIVFMHDGGTQSGIYNDVDNQWHMAAIRGGTTQLYHNGTAKIETTSTGISVDGGAVFAGTGSDTICANGINCRLRVLDENGTALNTC